MHFFCIRNLKIHEMVKKIIMLMVGCLLFGASLFAARQNEGVVKGSVVDAAGAPLPYATVYLTRADSTVVTGSAADDAGAFALKAAVGDYTLVVSLIGYRDARQELHLEAGLKELEPIALAEDASLLEGAAVQAVMPKTKLTGEGLQTSVRGSVLENAGTANDVLAKTPGLIKGQNGLEVIGKGTPLYYVNGHKVTDASELDRLQSNEIQSIEVISNPGAQYDATVRSVVRIRTIRRQGDGFGFSLDASDEQSLRRTRGNDPVGSLNVNYRTGGVDLFGGVDYAHGSARQLSDITKTTFGKTAAGADWTFVDQGDLDVQTALSTFNANAGINWQIADNHSLGGKVEWGRHLTYGVTTYVHDNVYENGTLTDRLSTQTDDRMGALLPQNLGANLYYNGLVGGKLGIDVNLDYYGTDDSAETVSQETSEMTHDATIHSESSNSGRLYAAKAVLSYPVWQGQLQVGTEETFSRRSDVYAIKGIEVIPATSALVREDNMAGFASYGFVLPKVGMFNAGLRYEYVRYSYADALNPESDLSRNYGNWFPNFSYAGAAGPVQLMLSYSAKTRRPNYSLLSGAIRYNNRYIWQSGNAGLQPELSHNLSLTAIWKFVTLAVNYTRTDDAIMVWSEPYGKGQDGVILVRPLNIDAPYRNLSAFVNLTPTIGPWNLNYTLGAMPQWLSICVKDPREASGERVARFNGKPVFFAQLLHTLSLKGGWQFELGGMVQSKGYSQNLYLTHTYFDLTAAVQKTLLRDGSLVLRLEGKDLAGTAHYNVESDFGSHTIAQTNIMDTQRVKLSLRYSFNTAQSKYRGTGAGADQKARM